MELIYLATFSIIYKFESTMRKTTLFKKLILDPAILILPVPHDALCAKIVQHIGFKACCVGGYASSATLIG